MPLAFDKLLTKQRCIAGACPRRASRSSSSPHRMALGWKPPVVLSRCVRDRAMGLQLVDESAAGGTPLPKRSNTISELLVKRTSGPGSHGRHSGRGALPIVEIRPKEGAYTLPDKYTVGATNYLLSARWTRPPPDASRLNRGQRLPRHRGRDYARVDRMIVRPDGEPGGVGNQHAARHTETSLFPRRRPRWGLTFRGCCSAMAWTGAAGAPAPSR